MGYSKWRKILTILMIISICFTLFGKISKVFATDVDANPTSIYVYGKYYNFYLYNLVSDYNYYFLFNYNDFVSNSDNPNGKGIQNLILYCSDEKINFRTEIDNNGDITGYVFYESENNKHSIFSILDKTTQRYNYDVIASSFSTVGFDNSLNSGQYTTISGSLNYPESLPYVEQGINVHFSDFYADHYYKRYSLVASSNYDPEYNFLYSNYDIIDERTDETFFLNSTRKAPELATPISDLENLTFEGLSINSWDYSNIDFYLLIYDRTLIKNDYDYVLNPAREILLNKDSEFYQPYLTSDPDSNCIYWVPITEIGLQFAKNGVYEIRFGIRKYEDNGGFGGGGFRGDEDEDPTPTLDYNEIFSGGYGASGGYVPKYYYEYIGENYAWSLDENISQITIDNINNQIKLTDEQRRHYEQMSLLEQLLNGDITSNDSLIVSSGLFKENNQDVTISGFNGIFTMFYNSISSSPQPVTFTVPYTNTPLVINPNLTYNFFGNSSALTLWHSFIYFAISLYIVKDIQHIIELVKTGDITTTTDTNIKADML